LGVAEDFRIAGLYGPHRLDANGDQTHSELALRDPALHQAAIKQEAEEYGAGLTDDALGWQLWREFAETLQGRGACVIFVPPPMMFKLEYVERDQESRFYRELPASARRNGLYYLGDPREFLYSPDWFFDTNYHLVAQKREFYTRALINLIGDHPLARCHEIESG
jgi:hypothetical protein